MGMETSPESNNKPKEYMTLEQAARVSGYTQDYLGQLARTGKLKAIRSGHNWVTDSQSLDKFLEKRNKKRN